MRAVRISLVLFVLMGVVIVGSMIMNHRVTSHMYRVVDALPPVPDAQVGEALAELEAFWQRWREWMRPTVNPNTWRSVNNLVETLAVYGQLGSKTEAEYVGTRIQLLLAIKEMSRPEWAALENLF